MTREEIERLKDSIKPFEGTRKDWYEIGCLDGLAAADAEPNLKSLWHDANEKPRTKEWLLVQFGEDDYYTHYLNDLYIDMWYTWCKTYNVIRWAYISDLLKGGEK